MTLKINFCDIMKVGTIRYITYMCMTHENKDKYY